MSDHKISQWIKITSAHLDTCFVISYEDRYRGSWWPEQTKSFRRTVRRSCRSLGGKVNFSWPYSCPKVHNYGVYFLMKTNSSLVFPRELPTNASKDVIIYNVFFSPFIGKIETSLRHFICRQILSFLYRSKEPITCDHYRAWQSSISQSFQRKLKISTKVGRCNGLHRWACAHKKYGAI